MTRLSDIPNLSAEERLAAASLQHPNAFIHWLAGRDLRQIYTPRSFSHHQRKILDLLGVDIATARSPA